MKDTKEVVNNLLGNKEVDSKDITGKILGDAKDPKDLTKKVLGK